MFIYLINSITNEVITTYEIQNVISWDVNYIEFNNEIGRCKIYAGDNEYFTDKEVDNGENI